MKTSTKILTINVDSETQHQFNILKRPLVLLPKQLIDCHCHTKHSNPRTLSLSNACTLPKYARKSSLVAIKNARYYSMYVGACADEKEDHCEQTLEVEKSTHSVSVSCSLSLS